MKNLICYLLFLAFFLPLSAQNHSVFHIGHSLVSPYMPAMLNTFADSTPSVSHAYNYGIINGSPLFWAWDNSGTCQGYQASTVDSRVELASGNYDVFVMTEGVPWDPILSDFHAYADDKSCSIFRCGYRSHTITAEQQERRRPHTT